MWEIFAHEVEGCRRNSLMQVIVMIRGYLAALVFFFYTRHHPREV